MNDQQLTERYPDSYPEEGNIKEEILTVHKLK